MNVEIIFLINSASFRNIAKDGEGMGKISKSIVIICIVVILLTLRIKKNDDGFIVQFGIWQLIKSYLGI